MKENNEVMHNTIDRPSFTMVGVNDDTVLVPNNLVLDEETANESEIMMKILSDMGLNSATVHIQSFIYSDGVVPDRYYPASELELFRIQKMWNEYPIHERKLNFIPLYSSEEFMVFLDKKDYMKYLKEKKGVKTI